MQSPWLEQYNNIKFERFKLVWVLYSVKLKLSSQCQHMLSLSSYSGSYTNSGLNLSVWDSLCVYFVCVLIAGAGTSTVWSRSVGLWRDPRVQAFAVRQILRRRFQLKDKCTLEQRHKEAIEENRGLLRWVFFVWRKMEATGYRSEQERYKNTQKSLTSRPMAADQRSEITRMTRWIHRENLHWLNERHPAYSDQPAEISRSS